MVLWPPLVTTLTSTVPAPLTTGVVAWQDMLDGQTTLVAAFAPKVTVGGVVPTSRLVPVIVVVVPPVVGPCAGVTPVMVGGVAVGGETRQRWPCPVGGRVRPTVGSSPT